MSMPTVPDHSMVVESAWRDQAIWSDTANRLKQQLARWRSISAAGGVLGVALTTLAASPIAKEAGWAPLPTTLSLAGALLLALVPYVQKVEVSPAKVSAWTRARSASEALKEAIYRFLMAVPPADPTAATEGAAQAATAPDPSSAAALVRRCQAIKIAVADLNMLAAASSPAKRSRPLTLGAADYLRLRVNDQIDAYYGPRAQQAARAAKRLRRVEFWLGLLAVLLGALSSTEAAQLPLLAALAPWVGVATTATGAVTAHLAAARHEHIATVFFATAERLRGLRDEWLADAGREAPERVAAFVDGCERAISAETEGWLADWNKDSAAG